MPEEGGGSGGRGILFVTSTPIGNLSDISPRALRVLRQVDVIACEDTRVTLKLLSRYRIKKALVSFHAGSSRRVLDRITGIIRDGRSVAYVTDGGTPAVSDPGCTLVSRVVDAGGEVIPIPGPSAVHASLAASGICFSEYTFLGFLSNKSSRRRRKLEEVCSREGVFVFFESPHRLIPFLHDVLDICGEARICLSKEMTKLHETHYRGSVSDVTRRVEKDGARGEYTVVLDTRRTGRKAGENSFSKDRKRV
jgi:16S rRNA (cytidine1402-2'-O)-methyltransferase